MIGTGNIGTGLMGPETPKYPSPTALPASAVAGTQARVANAWVPGGYTNFIYDAVSGWVPMPGELLAKIDGTAANPWLLDLTATALTPGVWTEVYQSAVLPDWMFADGATNMLICEYGVFDASSTAVINTGAGVSSSAFASVVAPFSSNYAGNTGGRTGGASPVRLRRDGANFRGSQGVSAAGGGTHNTAIGAFASGQMRFRLSVAVGATTNRIQLAGFGLFAGYP